MSACQSSALINEVPWGAKHCDHLSKIPQKSGLMIRAVLKVPAFGHRTLTPSEEYIEHNLKQFTTETPIHSNSLQLKD